MSKIGVVRWHLFHLMLLTSVVWIVFGICVLVYYMECSADNTKDCKPRSLSKSFYATNQQISYTANDYSLKSQSSFETTSEGKDEPTLLSRYSSEQLNSWEPVVLKSNPPNWTGECGKGVIIGPEELELKNEKFEINKFNLLASDRIALNRTLPDPRLDGCKRKHYPRLLPSTSIVIVFHNEAWSTLLRTVHSIIRTSPIALIKEIILVDDASQRDYLGEKLEDYVSKLSVPVRVLRTGKRSGLIRARLIGAAETKGQVITFLDAHCECTKGWLEPLLARIVEDRTRVVCPIIDVISDENFEYIPASDMTWGGFNWKLNFRWYRVPKRELQRRNNDRTLPVRTPTMAGGLFSIDRDYFELLGKYDEGMDIWGGENLELSFRIWMCGGTLEIVTCSHVGHVFRKSTPYTFPGGTSKIVNHNNARLADVWLDEWKEFYYAINPASKTVDKGDTESRKKLRKDLKCKDFRWYLENIYPESQMPIDYYSLGEIRNIDNNYCLDTLKRKSGGDLGMTECNGQASNQLFAYTKRKQIIADDNCLDASHANKFIKLIRCHNMGGNQIWHYNYLTKAIIHKSTKLCLDKTDPKVDAKPYPDSDPKSNPKKHLTLPLLRPCNGRSSQKWVMSNNFKWQLFNDKTLKSY